MKLEQQTQEYTDLKKEFLVNELKEKLDILDKYKVFAELERRVLKPAKLNINKHSDIHIEYRVKRKAKTPVSIVFKARYKNKTDKLKNLQPESFKLTKESEVSPSQENNNLPEQDRKVASKWLNELKDGLKR